MKKIIKNGKIINKPFFYDPPKKGYYYLYKWTTANKFYIGITRQSLYKRTGGISAYRYKKQSRKMKEYWTECIQQKTIPSIATLEILGEFLYKDARAIESQSIKNELSSPNCLNTYK